MLFFVTFMCCEYRGVSLMMRVQPIQRATSLCDSAFNGSKDALCIQPSVLELYLNTKMCKPCLSCMMVM